MVLYVSKNIWDHDLCRVLEILNHQLKRFSVQTIDMEYQTTEPAIWRMMPMWRRDVEIFHTRDIDSMPTEAEYKYTKAFEKSKYSIGTLRTHQNHYGVKCRMLAGLSSFKPEKIPMYIKGPGFQEYYAKKHNWYGSDQDLMIKTFTEDKVFTANNFFDGKHGEQKNKQDFPCIEAKECDLNFQISEEATELFKVMRDEKLNNWPGEPVDARGHMTDYLASKEQFVAVKQAMLDNKKIACFYGVT